MIDSLTENMGILMVYVTSQKLCTKG